MMLKKCVAGSPSSRKVWPAATVCGARITASRPRSWSSMAPQMLKRRAAQVSHACALVCGAVRLGTLATARARDMATPVVKHHLMDGSIDACGIRENSDLYLRGSTYARRRPRGYCCRDGGGSFDKLSDCVAFQAFCHGRWSRRTALRMVRSLRMHATITTILGLPLARSRWRKARMVGL